MEDFIERMKEEQLQLDERINKLYAFLYSDGSKDISPEHRALLRIQAAAMNTYNACLTERLELLGVHTEPKSIDPHMGCESCMLEQPVEALSEETK